MPSPLHRKYLFKPSRYNFKVVDGLIDGKTGDVGHTFEQLANGFSGKVCAASDASWSGRLRSEAIRDLTEVIEVSDDDEGGGAGAAAAPPRRSPSRFASKKRKAEQRSGTAVATPPTATAASVAAPVPATAASGASLAPAAAASGASLATQAAAASAASAAPAPAAAASGSSLVPAAAAAASAARAPLADAAASAASASTASSVAVRDEASEVLRAMLGGVTKGAPAEALVECTVEAVEQWEASFSTRLDHVLNLALFREGLISLDAVRELTRRIATRGPSKVTAPPGPN